MTTLLPYPPELRATGTSDAPFRPPSPRPTSRPARCARVTFGDLDVLLAHTSPGSLPSTTAARTWRAALDRRARRLHRRLPAPPRAVRPRDRRPGEMPTTGGLWPDGTLRARLVPARPEPKVDPPGKKADARRLTRDPPLPLLPTADRRRHDRDRRPRLGLRGRGHGRGAAPRFDPDPVQRPPERALDHRVWRQTLTP